MTRPGHPGPRPWRRPPWWPEDQPWPPRSGGRRPFGPRFLWRIGCLLAAAIVFATAALTLTAWLAASVLGIVQVAGAVQVTSLAVLLGVAIVVAAGVRGIRRLIWPLRELVRAAGRIEVGDYSTRVPEHGPPELRSVARAFNSMTARLRANEERRRTFLADVTHELRTPLAVIRGQAEAIADGVYPGDADHVSPIIDAARTLEVLTEDLRTLALADAGSLVLALEPVDLAALAHDAVAAFQAQAEAGGVALTAETDPDLPHADLDPARMRGVVGNVVSNALRHTPAGGAVCIRVRALAGGIEMAVTDTGEGISPDLLPHVFERFVRAPGSRGSGLGLAIARDVVTAHGGTIDARSEPGSGTTVRLEFPLRSFGESG
ncbi:MAG TPA: HAMP domain-containing sensor histidine kinase [Candidatus Dormibacteraeota bacterium]|jgi:signal transduction histidine kinase